MKPKKLLSEEIIELVEKTFGKKHKGQIYVDLKYCAGAEVADNYWKSLIQDKIDEQEEWCKKNCPVAWENQRGSGCDTTVFYDTLKSLLGSEEPNVNEEQSDERIQGEDSK